MPASFAPGPLLGNSYDLGHGFRVRLRMARSSDLGPIHDCHVAQDDHGIDLAFRDGGGRYRPWRCLKKRLSQLDRGRSQLGLGASGLSTPD